MATGSSDSRAGAQREAFATTHWSVVLAAGQQNTCESAGALETLCRTYWKPLYTYVRRRGYAPADAQDLTQQFFARFLEKESFHHADPARGRFRTFLLKSLQHFLTDDWKRAHRLKRGGGSFDVPFDQVVSEARFATELTDNVTPERAYEERWAMTLLEQVLGHMREEYTRTGKERLFEALHDFLWERNPPVARTVVAKDLGLTEGALYAAVHRFREHYRQCLRAEIGHTVDGPDQVDAELRYLISVMSAGR